MDDKEDTNSGIKGRHDTVMVILQNNVKKEIEESCISVLPANDVISKNRRFAINLLKCQTLLPSGTFWRKENIATDYQCNEDTFTNTTITSFTNTTITSLQKNFIQWTLCRSTIASHNVKSIPSSQATKSVLSTQVKSITQHAFTPTIPYPVTEQDNTIYTCMKNFQNVIIQKNREYVGLQRKFNF